MAVKGLNSSIISNETRAPEVNNLSRRQKIAIVALVSPLLTKKSRKSSIASIMAIIPATWDMYDLIQGFLQVSHCYYFLL